MIYSLDLLSISKAVAKIRELKPVILSITNYVTMDFVANSLLALGAKPIMSVEEKELEELMGISDAVSLNIGTLDKDLLQRCNKVANYAKNLKKPVIFDPVGSGATRCRTEFASNFLKQITVVKGNASEIMSLYDSNIKTLGVESSLSTAKAIDAACLIAKNFNIVVVISGAEDCITDGERICKVHFGSSLMTLVTGMGCALNAIVAAFNVVCKDPFEASCMAVGYFGLSGHLAGMKTHKPAQFKVSFIDELYCADFIEMQNIFTQFNTNSSETC